MLNSQSAGLGPRTQSPWDSYRLWSLWEMLEISASEYIALGARLEMAVRLFQEAEDTRESPYGRQLTPEEKKHLRGVMEDVLAECRKLKLPVSTELVGKRMERLPSTSGEMDVLTEAIVAELRTQLFLFVPSHRARWYNLALPSIVMSNFPNASQELTSASNALAMGLCTAAVFHAMRAAEIGVRVLGTTLGATFPFGVELAEWANVLDQIDSKIKVLKGLPKGPAKDDDLKFYSEAAAQFRYFKDGWRVRVAHARATYDEGQAAPVVDNTIRFFVTLAGRLKE